MEREILTGRPGRINQASGSRGKAQFRCRGTTRGKGKPALPDFHYHQLGRCGFPGKAIPCLTRKSEEHFHPHQRHSSSEEFHLQWKRINPNLTTPLSSSSPSAAAALGLFPWSRFAWSKGSPCCHPTNAAHIDPTARKSPGVTRWRSREGG